jgi:hypothetical protein
MPQFYSPVTWQMTSAQLVTPTTSGLSAINSLQAAVTSSTTWSVTATGTTTAGYKYFECAPVGSNLYSEYRILFVERINTSTNKTAVDGQSPFNSSSFILMRFVPDGGRAGVTFTPANIETANDAYVGTNYKDGTNQVWHAFPSPWTAFWLYTGDGVMWIIDRQAATTHNIAAFGHVYVPSATCEERNGANSECGVPCFLTRRGMSSGTVTGTATSALISGTNGTGRAGFWRWTGVATRSLVYSSGSTRPGGTGPLETDNAERHYAATSGGAIFQPFAWASDASGGSYATFFSPYLMRGVFVSQNMKTRTTIQSGSPATTIGFTWFPDDSLLSAVNRVLAFMNTP